MFKFYLNFKLTYPHYQYKYREMVENSRLLNHRKVKNFVWTHFSDFGFEHLLKHHQIFVILLKRAEERFYLHCGCLLIVSKQKNK